MEIYLLEECTLGFGLVSGKLLVAAFTIISCAAYQFVDSLHA
jgi:predicted outer membrane lipoprotein